MNKRKLLVYLDPGFLENRGHYMNFSKHVHAEAQRRNIDIVHYVNAGTSEEYCKSNGLIPAFGGTAYVADTTPFVDSVEIVRKIDETFEKIIKETAGKAQAYDEIVYYMYTGHPAYISSLALHLSRHSHGESSISACVVLFYLSDRFCYGNDDGRYAAYLRSVSDQLDVLDPEGRIHVGIDSHTAQPMHAAHFSRPIAVVPFPHFQRAKLAPFPVKSSLSGGRPRVTYTGYPHSKYGFHLILELLARSIADERWRAVDIEIKLNFRIKEEALVERWKLLKERLSNLLNHEDYMEDTEYLEMLGRADVMLIPYGSQYNHDTSAVLVDALVNGSIVVAAAPTWMAKIASEHGSGCIYDEENADSFVAAVNEVLENFPGYKARTKLNMDGVCWKFSAEGLFDMLFPRWRVALLIDGGSPSGGAGVVNDVLVPPSMLDDGTAMLKQPLLLSQEHQRIRREQEARQTESKSLLAKLSDLSVSFLPSEKVPLLQRVAQLRAIVEAWDNRVKHRSRLEELHATSKRCIIIGTDVQLDAGTINALKNEIVFAPQQTMRLYDASGSKPAFLLLESAPFIQNNLDSIRKMKDVTKFVPYHHAHHFVGDSSAVFFKLVPRKSYPDGYDISAKAQEVVYTSVSVVGTTIQIALSLGYKEICLLGVDVTDRSEDKAELEKLYGEVVNVANVQGVKVVNIGLDMRVPHIPYSALEPMASVQVRAKKLVADVASGALPVDMSEAEVAYAEKLLLARHPCPSDIYLPTSKYQGIERVRAISKVVKAWNDRQAIYKARLRQARDMMQGRKRCFIIGNGPSLNKTDLELLAGEVTFATNGIFLKFPEVNFRPTYYVVEDHLVGEDRYKEINELTGFTKLAPYYLSYCLEDGDDVIYYNHRGRKSFPYGFDFSLNAEEITYTGCTVTFSCMQLAYYMGFKEIYLIGVDMSYVIPEQVKKANEYDTEILDMEVDDPNHFMPNYFGRGYRWHDPNVDKMEQAYIEARKVTEKNGAKIYNATVGGMCEVFDRVDYYGLFGKRGELSKLNFPGLASAPAAESIGASGYVTLHKPATGFIHGAHGEVFRLDKMLTADKDLKFSLQINRQAPRLLTFELGLNTVAECESIISFKVDGHVMPVTWHLEQVPQMVSLYLEPRTDGAQTDLAISWKHGARAHNGLLIARVSTLLTRTFLKGNFPLCYFDGVQYLRENPEVGESVLKREVLSGLSHYMSVGRKEGRRLPLAAWSRPNHGWRHEWVAAAIDSK